MSRQLLCVILLLQFHACFAARGLVFFHDKLNEDLLGSKEEEANSQMKLEHLTLKCGMKMENCMEAMEGIDFKLEKQKKKRMLQDMKMVEERSNVESSTSQGYDEVHESDNNSEPGEDIEVKDYAQPQRKPPIHNIERP